MEMEVEIKKEDPGDTVVHPLNKDEPLDLSTIKKEAIEIKTEEDVEIPTFLPTIHTNPEPQKIKTEPAEEHQTPAKEMDVDVDEPQNIPAKSEQADQPENGHQGPAAAEVKEEPPPKKSSKTNVKGMKGRIEIVRKIIRKIFCKLCMEQVSSLDKLVIHLDRQHNIRVKGPPRVVDGDDRDDKEDLQNTSNLLKCVDSKPRTTEPLSDSEDSDDDDENKHSDSDDDLFCIVSEEEEEEFDNNRHDRESAYIKLRERIRKRMFVQEGARATKIATQLLDSTFKKENFSQCKSCFVEVSTRPRFRFLKAQHMRQHTEGQYKHCPHCGMPFLFEHQLDKHLEDLAVPIVPPEFSGSEAHDLLHLTHPCTGGTSGSLGCGKEFANRKCLLFHLTRRHDHQHRCPSCEKPYILYSDLRKHIQRAHNWEKRMIACPVPSCDKLLKSKKGVSSHFIHCHTKEEKELYITSNKSNNNNNDDETNEVLEESSSSTTSIVLHKPPQTFWRMIADRTDKLRKHIEKKRAERAKHSKIYGKQEISSKNPSSLSPIIDELKKSPTAKSTPNMEIKNSINRLFRKPTTTTTPPDRITKRSSTSTSSTGPSPKKRRWHSLHGINSLPPKPYLGGPLDKNRNLFQHRTFTQVCGLCTRSFRTLGGRNRHFVDTHNINLSLAKPFICPLEGCNVAQADVRYLLGHIRRIHTAAVEKALYLRSLEEDKATAQEGEKYLVDYEYKNLTTDDVDDENEDETAAEGVEGSEENVDHENNELDNSLPEEPAIKVRKRISMQKTSGLLQMHIGPNAALAREIIKNFQLTSGQYYCPECPVGSRQSMYSPWTVHRHMLSHHPNSDILKNPGSVKLEVFNKEDQVKEGIGEGINNNEARDDQDKKEVESEKVEQQNEHDKNEHEGDKKPEAKVEDDFITGSSDPETLATFRQFLQQYRLYPDSKTNFSLACPICLEECKSIIDDLNTSSGRGRTYSNVHNLQRHIFKLHLGSDLLRKSSLEQFIVTSPQKEEVAKPEINFNQKQQQKILPTVRKLQFSRGFHRRHTTAGGKIKIKAKSFVRGGKKRGCRMSLSPLGAYLAKCKTECGKKFFCPVCASANVTRVFGYSANVARHMKLVHPRCELLKTLSYSKVYLKKADRVKARSQRKSETESDEEEDDEDDKVPFGDSDDDDLEVEPETFKEHAAAEDEEDEFEVAPPQKSDDDDDDNEVDSDLEQDPFLDVERVSPSKSIKKKQPVLLKEIKIKLEHTSSPAKKIKYELPTEPDADGRWSCALCPEEGRCTYTVVHSLIRHIATHHRNLKNLTVRSSSGKKSSATSAIATTSSQVRHRTVSNSTSISGQSQKSSSSNNSANSAMELEEKVLSDLEKIRAQTDPEKIQCPLCDQAKGHVYSSYDHFYRHLQRSCPVWKTMHPEDPPNLLSPWSCHWCSAILGSKQLFTTHVNKNHPEITITEFETYVQLVLSKVYTCDSCKAFCRTLTGFTSHRCKTPKSKPKKIKKEPEDDEPPSKAIKKEPIDVNDEDKDTPTTTTTSATAAAPKPSPPRRRSVSRPTRGSTQYFQPSYKDHTSSDEEFPGIRQQLEIIDRLSTNITTAIKRERPAESDYEGGSDSEEEEEMESSTNLICPICSKIFESSKSLAAHVSWHKRRNKTTPKTEQDLDAVKDRNEKQDEEDPAKVPCPICLKKFLPGRKLIAHQAWHTRRRRKSKAVSCERSSKRAKLDLSEDDEEDGDEVAPDEMMADEGEDGPLNLKVVETTTATTEGDAESSSSDLINDIMEDEPGSVVDAKCDFCEEWFSSPIEKSSHLALAHPTTMVGNPESQQGQ